MVNNRRNFFVNNLNLDFKWQGRKLNTITTQLTLVVNNYQLLKEQKQVGKYGDCPTFQLLMIDKIGIVASLQLLVAHSFYRKEIKNVKIL